MSGNDAQGCQGPERLKLIACHADFVLRKSLIPKTSVEHRKREIITKTRWEHVVPGGAETCPETTPETCDSGSQTP